MVSWIGDTEITAITDIDPSQGRPESTVKALGVEPFKVQHKADLETVSISAMLVQSLHSGSLNVDFQKDNVRSLMRANKADQSFTYRDYAGFLSVSGVNLPMSGDMANLRQGSISATYHPASVYQPSRAIRGIQYQNDFGHDVPGLFMLPSQARSVKVVNPNGTDEKLDPIHVREITEDQGIDTYSVFRFMNAWDGDNSGVTTSLRHEYRGMVSTELSASGDYTRPRRDSEHYTEIPSGDYTLKVRLLDSNQVSDDVRLKVEYKDGGWNEVLNETHTASGSVGVIESSRFTVDKNTEVRFQVEKDTANTNTIEVDGGWLSPSYLPIVKFDLEIDEEYDRAAFGFWPFVEGHGNSAQDFSPNNREAEFNGDPQWTSSSLHGDYAIELDGSDYLEFQTMFSGRLDATFSVSVNPDDLSADVGIAGEGASGTPSWRIYYDNTNDDWVAFARDVAGNTYTASGGTPTTGSWTTLGLVYESTNNTLQLFENGSQVASTTTSGNRLRYSTNVTRIGDDMTASNRFDGAVDAARAFWDDRSGDMQTFHDGNERLEPMDSFSTHPRVAPVRVYDHRNSTNEDDWVRVMNRDHKFKGGIVVQNGLVRFAFNDPATDEAHAYFWHQNEWQEIGTMQFKSPDGSPTTFVDNPRLVEANERTAALTFGIDGYVQEFSLHRGRYRGEFQVEGLNRIKVNTGNHVEVEAGYVPTTHFYSNGEGADVAVSSESDNYIIAFSPSIDAVYFASSTSSDGRQKIEDTGQKYGYDSLSTLTTYDISFGAIPLISSENLKQSSGTSLQVDGEREIPLGTYVAACRAQFSDTADEWTYDAENTTDASTIDIDGNGVAKSVTESSSYAWYQREIRIDDDDSGDNISLSWTQVNGTGSITIDEFILFPVSLQSGGDQMGVQDVTHEAMRAIRPESEVYQRSGVSR